MGEAKRRKRLDSSYGKSSALVGCFIAKSHLSDNHAVYLGIGTKDTVETRLISAHEDIERTWEVLGYCKEVLKKSRFLQNQGADEIVRSFCKSLLARYGDYPRDDSVAMLTPLGITYSKPPVEKTWVVNPLLIDDADEIKMTPNGFEDQCVFCVVSKTGERLMTENGHIEVVAVFSSYVTAAVIADYANKHQVKTNTLTLEEQKTLWTYANKLQGKI